MRFLLILILFLLSTSTVFALSSNELVKTCEVSLEKLPVAEKQEEAIRRFLDAGTCGGFIGGVVAGINLIGAILVNQGGLKNNLICVPPNLHAQQLVNIIVQDIKVKNKKLGEESAQIAIYQSLRKRYPCG